jgi:hypothetical protein
MPRKAQLLIISGQRFLYGRGSLECSREKKYRLLAIASRRTTKNDRPSYGAMSAFSSPFVGSGPCRQATKNDGLPHGGLWQANEFLRRRWVILDSTGIPGPRSIPCRRR